MSDLNLSVGTLSFNGAEDMKKALKAIKDNGIKEIDTAHLYGGGKNESDMGDAGIVDYGFEVSTKNMGGWFKGVGVALKKDNMLATARKSLKKMHIKQIDIFYIHAPDRTMKLEEWVPTIQELYDIDCPLGVRKT